MRLDIISSINLRRSSMRRIGVKSDDIGIEGSSKFNEKNVFGGRRMELTWKRFKFHRVV